MNPTNETYTYRGGEKPDLDKAPNEFVACAASGRLAESGITETEKISPNSSKVTTSEDESNTMVERVRNIATTHSAEKR